jgi:hypothetical protein
MKKRSGKTLVWLLVLLAAAIGAAAYVYVPKYTTYAKTSGVNNRMTVSSALLRAATRIQQEREEWPKDIKALQNEPEVADLPKSVFASATYDLVRIEDDGAIYKFEYQGRSSEVKVPKKAVGSEPPTLSNFAGAGG